MKRDLQLELDSTSTGPRAAAAAQWRYALPVVVGLLLWVLAWYASTAMSMVEIWRRSDTFAHGFLVPLISLWLVWRKRYELAAMTVRPSWAPLAAVVVVGFAWLIGELAAVNAASQLALTALLILTVICVLGTAIARKLAFPLLFLFFAVPVGEFILPYLMGWTADFTVAALRLSGIPVYREGQQLVIPTGVWAVVEACSGLRYLIASLMIGTLFAYLMYRSSKRRLMFVALAIAVPIVGNWLRAYMIVMLGHLSGNKIAVGVDHLIYGWLFFGVLMALLFWIGGRWREDHPEPVVTRVRTPMDMASLPRNRLWATAALLLVGTAVWKIGYFAVERSDASSRPHLASLNRIGDWQPSSDVKTRWTPQFVNPSADLRQAFGNGAQQVGVVVSYYRNQDRASKLVSSENVLVRPEDLAWVHVRSGARAIQFNGEPMQVRTAELRGPAGQELVVWQWYWINGRITESDHWAKAYTALSRLQGQGDDSAGIVIYTLKDRGDTADKTLAAFLEAAGREIEVALRQTRNTR
jgi:exosortase A